VQLDNSSSPTHLSRGSRQSLLLRCTCTLVKTRQPQTRQGVKLLTNLFGGYPTGHRRLLILPSVAQHLYPCVRHETIDVSPLSHLATGKEGVSRLVLVPCRHTDRTHNGHLIREGPVGCPPVCLYLRNNHPCHHPHQPPLASHFQCLTTRTSSLGGGHQQWGPVVSSQGQSEKRSPPQEPHERRLR
jgi:hypothetical protein